MKNLLLICAFVLASTSLFSQTVQLRITSISNQVLTLNSANLQMVSVTQRNGQSVKGKAYIISRNQDNLTASIMKAIAQGKEISNAELTVTLKNGTKIIHDMAKVSLSDYTSVNAAGSHPTEEFYLNFSSDVIREKK